MTKKKEEKVKVKDTINTIKKTWPYAKKYKKYIFLYAIILIFTIAISIITPLLSAKLVLTITNGLLDKVLIVAGAILFIEIAKNVCRYLSSVVTNKFYYGVMSNLQRNLTEETIQLDIKEVDKNSSGVFIDRITKDAGQLTEVFQGIMMYSSRIFANIGVLGAIFIINKIMFVYCIIALIIVYWAEKARIKSWYNNMTVNMELNEKNSGLIAELIRGIRDIKVLNSTNDFVNKVMDKIEHANNRASNLNISQQKYGFVSGSLNDITNFIYIVLGIILIKANNLTTDNLVVLYMYQSRIFDLLFNISYFNEELKRFTLSAKRVFEIVDGKFKKEKFGKKHLDKINGDFEFKNVNFSYEENRPILENLSFKVNANETVAFVGKSGSGKSTIFNLIDRLYKVNSGKITIDGIDINELDKDSIRDNISIITQTPYIFNFSIKENLTITRSDATDEEIIEACKIAQLHDYIMALPNKYDTIVGEGGLILSGGQRQRLAIARALLKKTEIILFDEATSSLDNETQKSIQKAINNMKGEYTILIIAHRLSTVIDSDRILVIDEGQVVSEGSHQELLETSEVYKNLYNKELE